MLMKVIVGDNQRDITPYNMEELLYVLRQRIAHAAEREQEVAWCEIALTAAKAKHQLALAGVSAAQKKIDDRLRSMHDAQPTGTLWKPAGQ